MKVSQSKSKYNNKIRISKAFLSSVNAVTIKVFGKFSSLAVLINSVTMKKRKPLAVIKKINTNTGNDIFDDITRNLPKYTKKPYLGKVILRSHYKQSEYSS